MIPMVGASGSTPVPPPAVSTAAWPREGSVLAFIAANCGQCEQIDVCDISGTPEEPCEKLMPRESKQAG